MKNRLQNYLRKIIKLKKVQNYLKMTRQKLKNKYKLVANLNNIFKIQNKIHIIQNII